MYITRGFRECKHSDYKEYPDQGTLMSRLGHIDFAEMDLDQVSGYTKFPNFRGLIIDALVILGYESLEKR